jgi:hypothetical protein
MYRYVDIYRNVFLWIELVADDKIIRDVYWSSNLIPQNPDILQKQLHYTTGEITESETAIEALFCF